MERTDREPAVHAAGRWARQFLISEPGFQAAVTDITPESVELTQVRWRGRSRRVVVRQSLTTSRSRKLEEPLDPRRFDAWAERSEEMAVKTLQVARCRACGGDKKVLCRACRGSAMVRCEACGGSGSIWSSRSRRLVNCKSCRGNGERRCGCRDGWLSCEACDGKGKVDEWLEVTEETFERVTSAGNHALAEALSKDPDAVPLALSWRGSAVEEAPPDLQKLLRRPDLMAVRPPEDRLQEVSLEVFRSEITTVYYQLGGIAGSVQTQGWDDRIVENGSSRRPFDRRRRRTLQGASAAILAGAALTVWYGARHSFFLSTANYKWLWVLSLSFGLCIVPFLLWLVLPPSARRLRTGVLASLPALLVALTQAGVAATGGPSLDHARAALAQGHTEKALQESTACFDLAIDADSAAQFHDHIQLERIRQTRDPEKAWKATSLPFLTLAGGEQARAHAVEVTFQASAALQERGEFTASAALLDSAPAELGRTEPLLGLRRRIYLEEALPLWKVIKSRRQSLEERMEACRAIDPQIRALAALPAPPEGLPLEEPEVEATCESLREQRLREIERQREAEARKAERERKRAEAARESAQRRWASARLRCNDGTLSPSCICGGSRRGCCSWHGGVAGCSVDYPN